MVEQKCQSAPSERRVPGRSQESTLKHAYLLEERHGDESVYVGIGVLWWMMGAGRQGSVPKRGRAKVKRG